MAESKRIIISLPTSLLAEVDVMTEKENKNRSEFIREAMRFYLEEGKKSRLRDAMRKGYLEMAEINLLLAEEGMNQEEEVNGLIQGKLTECCG